MQPVGIPKEPDDRDPGGVIDPKVIAERRARRAELNEGTLRERAVKAEAQLGTAQRQLDGAHEQRKELAAALKRAERDLRTARQGEHAEAHRREEIEEDAAAARRDAEQRIASVQAALAAEEQRVSELEDELFRFREGATRTRGDARAALRDLDELVGHADDASRRQALAEADALLAARLEEVALLEGRLEAGLRELQSRRGGLKLRLHDSEAVAGGLEEQLVSEREARVRATRALESERERAAAEVTLLQHELDRRLRVQRAVARQLVELRAELQATQAQRSTESGRRTVTESVLSDLGTTALQLRDELRELQEEREEVQRRLRAARAQVAERDAAIVAAAAREVAAEAAIQSLREQLDEAAAALRTSVAEKAQQQVRLDAAELAMAVAEDRSRELVDDLQDERHERARVESRLHLVIAEERGAFQTSVEHHKGTLQAAMARERAEFELQVAKVRDAVDEVRERLLQVEADVGARLRADREGRKAAELALGEECEGRRATTTAQAEERIVELEDELEQMRVALRPPPPLPPSDHPALKEASPAGPADPAQPDSVIIDLARAAARLRIGKDVTAVADEHDKTDDGGVSDLMPASGEIEIGRRTPAMGRQAPKAWLTPAIMSLARRDGHAAALVIEALVPVQAARLRRNLLYDLVVNGHPELRVQLSEDGTAAVAPRTAEDPPATFRIAGTPVALAPLAGGAVGRRVPAGIVVSGRRRKARRLTKVLRDPVTMAGIAEAGVTLAPQHLLALLAGAIDTRLLMGERFTIAFADVGGDVHTHVTVSDSQPILVRAGEGAHAAATVRTAPGTLAGFLAGEEPGRVRGDVSVVGKLLGWADVTQGLDG